MTLIAHLDLDAFFASVEMRLRPVLARRPLVVAGLGARSVVSAASYPARSFGVFSGQPLATARARCPDLVVVAPRFAAYREVSARVFSVVSSLSDVVEVLGVDEAFAVPSFADAHVDGGVAVSGTADHSLAVAEVNGSVELAAASGWAERVRALVRASVGLPLSVGVADSKVAAKLCSRRGKPDGVFALASDESLSFLQGVSVAEVPGVGPRTLDVLEGLGVRVVGDVLTVPERVLVARLGAASASWLLTVVRNSDDRPVLPAGPSAQIGVSRTFDHGVTADELGPVFDEVLGEVLRRLRGDGRSAGTVTVRFGLLDGTDTSASTRLAAPTRDPGLLARAARELSSRAPVGPLRLLGVAFTGLSDQEQLVFDGLVDVPSFTVPVQPPLSLLDRAFHGMPVCHPQFGEGVLLGVLEQEPRPVLDGDPFCVVRFDRERIVSSSHLNPSETTSETT